MATTATVETPVYDLKLGIRKLGAANNILRQGVEDMIDEIKADTFKVVSNAEGTKYVHLLNSATEDYFSIKVGKKVITKKKGADLIKELFENCVVYTGVTDNGVWFTFGPVGEAGEAEVEISLADLKKMKLRYYAG